MGRLQCVWEARTQPQAYVSSPIWGQPSACAAGCNAGLSNFAQEASNFQCGRRNYFFWGGTAERRNYSALAWRNTKTIDIFNRRPLRTAKCAPCKGASFDVLSQNKYFGSYFGYFTAPKGAAKA